MECLIVLAAFVAILFVLRFIEAGYLVETLIRDVKDATEDKMGDPS